VQTRFLPRPQTVKIRPQVKSRPRDKCCRGRTSGRHPRTSRRKGRPDGNFHPKTSVMTTLSRRGPQFRRLRPGRLLHSHHRPQCVKAQEKGNSAPSRLEFRSRPFSLAAPGCPMENVLDVPAKEIPQPLVFQNPLSPHCAWRQWQTLHPLEIKGTQNSRML
jgi:hypothetical protein